MKLLLRLLKYVSPYKKELVLASLCMLFFSLCNIAVMPLVSRISTAVGNKDFGQLNLLVAIAIAIFFFKGVFQYGQGYLASFIGQRVVTDMRVHLFSKLQNLSIEFYSEWKTGEIMSRVINDILAIQNAILIGAMEVLPQMLTLVGVLGYLFYLNWSLTLVALLTTPVFFFAISKFGKEMREVGRKAQRKIADISSILQETISGVRTVKSFTMEKKEVERFANESEKSFGWSMKESQIDCTQKPIMGFLQVLAVLIVIYYGCLEVVGGRLSPSDLIAFFAGAFLLIDPIIGISKINTTVQKALSCAERVFEVIDIEPSIKDSENATDLPEIKGAVNFEDVHFSYRNNVDVLEDINLSVSPGETIAIVGPSGAGKTSFVNLLLRFYDPTKGRILIDGHDIKDVKTKSLRRQIGIVPQDTMLFSGTVEDNIKYGKPDATHEEVMSAAIAANAHEFIEDLSKGYKTETGERGVSLSGGQRQRIAIARALLRDPKILILDEATSSLDTESERLIQDAVINLITGRTAFVIAHRLSTVQSATRIIVLKEGRIVEEGTHQQLLSNNGLYKKLYDLQFEDGLGDTPH